MTLVFHLALPILASKLNYRLVKTMVVYIIPPLLKDFPKYPHLIFATHQAWSSLLVLESSLSPASYDPDNHRLHLEQRTCSGV